MTRTPMDRGFAFIKRNADGTSEVTVAEAVSASGTPEKIVAVHFDRPGVDIGGSLTFVRAGGNITRTTEEALVRGGGTDGEVVRIRADR